MRASGEVLGALDITALAKLRRRLISHVIVQEESRCWLADLAPREDGYCYLKVRGVSIAAHRVSYWMYHGQIPGGLLIRHICDVRMCVRPSHLAAGTQSDNMRDCSVRGRMGDRAKLTWGDVREIRRRTDDSIAELAAEYRVSSSTISRIRNHRLWIEQAVA